MRVEIGPSSRYIPRPMRTPLRTIWTGIFLTVFLAMSAVHSTGWCGNGVERGPFRWTQEALAVTSPDQRVRIEKAVQTSCPIVFEGVEEAESVVVERFEKTMSSLVGLPSDTFALEILTKGVKRHRVFVQISSKSVVVNHVGVVIHVQSGNDCGKNGKDLPVK